MASNKHQRTSSHPIHTTTKKSTSHSKTRSVILSGEALNSALIKPVDLNVLLTESDRQQNVQALREKLLKKSVTFLKKKCKALKISAQGNKTELIHKIIQHQQTNHKDNKQHHLSKPKRNVLNSKSYNKSNKNKTRNKNNINDKKKKKKKKNKKNKTKQKTEYNTSTNTLEETLVRDTVIPPTNKSVNTSADILISIKSSSKSWKCSKCTFINVLATKICAMCELEKSNQNNEKKCNTQRSEMEIITLLVDGYINNIGQLSNLQIIPIEINAICFEYYYFTLKRWLKYVCCLPQYFGAFSMNGFNELSVVSLIESREYLQNIDIISTIHQNKIWTEIVKLQQENGKNDYFQFYYSTSINRLERWLESFGLKQYFELFDKRYIFVYTMTMYIYIESIHKLEKIGIKLKGHQVKIWDEIKKLKRQEEREKERKRIEEMEKEKERMEKEKEKEKEILEYRHKLYLIQQQKEEKESEKLKEEIRAWNREKIYIQKGQKNIAYIYNDNISENKKAEIIQRIKKESYKRICWCERIKTARKNYTFNVSISDGAYLCDSCRLYQLPPYNDAI